MANKPEVTFSRSALDLFLNEFELQIAQLQVKIDRLKEVQVQADCNEILLQSFDCLTELRSKLSHNSELLPAYEMKRLQSKLDLFGETISQAKQAFKPVAKFAFKKLNKPNKTSKPASNVSMQADPDRLKVVTQGNVNSIIIIANKTKETISQPLTAGTEVDLVDLRDCEVVLLGTATTLRINRCEDCDIKVGPIERSIFVNDCLRTNFHLTCQQLRIHTTRDCDFHVHVTSGAIIETCSKLRFHALKWKPSDYELQLKQIGLRSDVNVWNQVQDFDWLVNDKPSPNWIAIE